MPAQEKDAELPIGFRLGLVLDTWGRKLSEFAKAAAIPYRTIQDYVHERRYPSTKSLVRMAHEGVDLVWLLTGKPSVALRLTPVPTPGLGGFLGDQFFVMALERRLVKKADEFGRRRFAATRKALDLSQFMTVMDAYYEAAIRNIISLEVWRQGSPKAFREMSKVQLAIWAVDPINETMDEWVERRIAEQPWS